LANLASYNQRLNRSKFGGSGPRVTVRLGVRGVSMHLRIYFAERPAEGAAARRHIVVRVSGGAAAPAPVHFRTSQRAFRRAVSRSLARQISAIPPLRFFVDHRRRVVSAARRFHRALVSSENFAARFSFDFRSAIACGLRAAAAADGEDETGRDRTGQDRLFWTATNLSYAARPRFTNRPHRSCFIKSAEMYRSRAKNCQCQTIASSLLHIYLFIFLSITLTRNFCD